MLDLASNYALSDNGRSHRPRLPTIHETGVISSSRLMAADGNQAHKIIPLGLGIVGIAWAQASQVIAAPGLACKSGGVN
jgi:hypothetical protein